MITVVFACPGRGALALLAAARFNASADPRVAVALAAAREPSPEHERAMRETLRATLPGAERTPLEAWTPALEERADWVIAVGGDGEPSGISPRRAHWPLREPSSAEELSVAQSEIARRVRALIAGAGWSVGTWL